MKNTFYLSEKHPDKLINEGIVTMFSEMDEVKKELRAMLKPNGSQQAPARSCYDLFLCNPSFAEGGGYEQPNYMLDRKPPTNISLTSFPPFLIPSLFYTFPLPW